jgi:D-sedoheptulose 7-phosphate isomerase
MKASTLGQAGDRFSTLLGRIAASSKGAAVEVDAALEAAVHALEKVRQNHGTVLIIGNGGSAAVAAHIQNDLVNKGGLRAHVLHEPSLLTCMSNDFGYENAFARLVERYARSGDLLIAISSSGRSGNILAAQAAARAAGAGVLTFSGFDAGNPLRLLGDVNFWSPSDDYGEVEVSHLFLLHYIADCLAERS